MYIDRLIVDRPHPWGIMYSFVELLKDKEFYKKKHILRDPEFDEILRYVFKSMGKPPAKQP